MFLIFFIYSSNRGYCSTSDCELEPTTFIGFDFDHAGRSCVLAVDIDGDVNDKMDFEDRDWFGARHQHCFSPPFLSFPI